MSSLIKWKRIRWVLALALVGVAVAFWQWQTPGNKLSAGEIDSYLERIESGLPMPAAEKSEFIARLRSWGAADDGRPVHMLNLIRFHDKMPVVPGHPEFSGTAEEANAHYERATLSLLAERGVYPVFMSTAQGLETDTGEVSNLLGFDSALEGWDRIILVRYPSRRSFLDMASDPAYLELAPFKLAAIDLGFVPLDKHFMVPDLRWVVVLLVLAVFLACTAVFTVRRTER